MNSRIRIPILYILFKSCLFCCSLAPQQLSTFNKHDKTQLLAKVKKILYMWFRATLNFRKFKVALNPMYRIFLNFAKSCVLSSLSNVDDIKIFHRAVQFELWAPKAVIKGVFSKLYCYYGNLLCHNNGNNVFTNGWVVFWFHVYSIKW